MYDSYTMTSHPARFLGMSNKLHVVMWGTPFNIFKNFFLENVDISNTKFQ